MIVLDTSGKKVGTIIDAYRTVNPIPATTLGGAKHPLHNEVIEIKTGPFGFGPHLYIPTSAIDDGREDSVFLSKAREEFESLGWREEVARGERP
jgi:hypothetical protein